MPVITLNLDEPRFDRVNLYREAYYYVQMKSSDMFDDFRNGRLMLDGINIAQIYRDYDDRNFLDRNKSTPVDMNEDVDRIINTNDIEAKNKFIEFMYDNYVSGKNGLSIHSVNGGYSENEPVVRFIWCDKSNIKSVIKDMSVSNNAYDNMGKSVTVVAIIKFFGKKIKEEYGNIASKVLKNNLGLDYEKAVLDHIRTLNMYPAKKNSDPVPVKELAETEHSDEYFNRLASQMNLAESVICANQFKGNTKEFLKYNNKDALYKLGNEKGIVGWDADTNSGKPIISNNACVYATYKVENYYKLITNMFVRTDKKSDAMEKYIELSEKKQGEVDNNPILNAFALKSDTSTLLAFDKIKAPYIEKNNKKIKIFVNHIGDFKNLFSDDNDFVAVAKFEKKELDKNNVITLADLEKYAGGIVLTDSLMLKNIYYVANDTIIKLK